MIKHNKNYHMHTYLCNHAEGKPIDYVKEALKHNYLEVGMSDHLPMPEFVGSTRMRVDEFSLYLEMLNEAEIYANKHNIKFFKGGEIEYLSNNPIYERYLKDLDYLILGQHYIVKENNYKSVYKLDDLEDIIIYRNTLIEALQTGYFNLLCHPDLCFYNIKNPTKEMYEALRPVVIKAKELNIPIEFNANGIRKAKNKFDSLDEKDYLYPRMEFFKIVKEENAQVHVSSDAHYLIDLHDYAIEKSYKLINQLGLEVVDTLKMKYYK